jgi:type VI secretion system protein
MKERLLKRMSQWEEAAGNDYTEADSSELMESIKDDLEKLFNTKRGTVLIDDDYGLPDFSYMLNGYTAPDVGQILQQLHLQAKEYEPRLQALHVKYVEKNALPGKLKFQLSAKLMFKEQEFPFSVSALLSDDGSIELSF